MSNPNGNVNAQAVRGPQTPTPESLEHVPQATTDQFGLGKYKHTPSKEEPYYVHARIADRAAHQSQLEGQVADLNRLFN